MPYKNKISCVYTITNLVNGKIYVGYTNDFNRRKVSHNRSLINNNHDNKYIQNEFNKKGNIFKIEILEECEKEFLCSQEHYWATILNVHNRKFGYNLKSTHPDNKVNGFKGKKHSSYTIKKMKLAQLGIKRKLNSEWGKKWIKDMGIINKNLFSKAIVILDKNKKYVKEFNSLKECSIFLETAPKNISCALNNTKGQKTAKGHYIILKSKYYEGGKETKTPIS